MILLDTDHLSILQHPESPLFGRLSKAIEQSADQKFATTAISLEEQMRGWLAAIHRQSKVHDQLLYYVRLTGIVQFYSRWKIMPFDEPAADLFMDLRKAKVRIGTFDLKIAAIAIAQQALLVSANIRDFEQVPGLRVEDWLH